MSLRITHGCWLLLATLAIGMATSAVPTRRLLEVHSSTRAPHAPFYWLHIPKTGSSFAATIGASCCGNQSIHWPWYGKRNLSQWSCMDNCLVAYHWFPVGSHAHLPRVIEDEDGFFASHAVITNLRHPKSRLASGFFHNFHDCEPLQHEAKREMGHLNITAADFRGLVVAYLKAVIANNTWLESKLQRYVECVRGCSVSMIAGYACGDHGSRELSSISKEIMDFSLRRIEKFSYVGFQEYWESSVRLFLAKFGGNFSVELLYNSRKGHMEFTEEEESKVESLLNQPDAGFRDEYDEAPTTTPFHSTGRIRYLDNNKPINQ